MSEQNKDKMHFEIPQEEWPYIAPPVIKKRDQVKHWLENVLKDPEIKVLKPDEPPFEENQHAYEKGMQLFSEHRYDEAAILLKKAFVYNNMHLFIRHRHDYPDALVALGWLYEFGIGIKKDPGTAFSYYRQAAEAGNPDGCWGLCSAYLQLENIDENQNEAFARFAGEIPDDPEFKAYQKELAKRSLSWEDVYVFISSTFNDMNAERDFLVKKVIPELRVQCAEHRLKLAEIDLRWGIKEEDAEKNKKVVDICLNNVDRCRPFFLCFLGQRLGWVPMPQDISPDTLAHFPGLKKYLGERAITEMEIIHALIDPMGQDEHRSKMDGFFYFRDPSYLENIQTEELRELYCPGNQDSKRLESLKQEIGEQFQTHTYQGIWNENDPSQGSLTDFSCEGKPLKDIIIAELMRAIKERYPGHWERKEEQDGLERELEEQDNYLLRLNDGYLYRDGLEDVVTQALANNNGICILESPSGSGKSSFLSDMILNTKNLKMVRQYYRFIGATDQSLSIDDALCSLYKQFMSDGTAYIDQTDLAEYEHNPRSHFSAALNKLKSKQVFIIFLDGIDQEVRQEIPYWIPRSLPSNVKLVLSYDAEAEQIREFLQQEEYPVVTLKDFGEESEKRALIETYLSQYLKSLDENQITRILSMEGSSNPLFLKILLEELRIYGSFETLSDLLNKGFGSTPEDAFEHVIRRLYRECADEKESIVVKTILGALSLAESSVSLSGLCHAVSMTLGREEEYDKIEDQVLQLIRQLYPYLNLFGDRVGLMYGSFKKAYLRVGGEKEENSYQCLFEACKSMFAEEQANNRKRKPADVRGIYVYGGRLPEKVEENLSLMLKPQILEEAVKEIGCLTLADAFGQINAEAPHLKAELEEFGNLLRDAADAVRYHPFNLFTELEKHADKENRIVQNVLALQKKEISYPRLEITYSDGLREEIRPVKSISALKFSSDDSVKKLVVPPYIIYGVDSFYRRDIRSCSIYVQDLLSGRILKTWYTPYLGYFNSDGKYLYFTDRIKYYVMTLPELQIIWEGEYQDRIDGTHSTCRPFGRNGKIYDEFNEDGYVFYDGEDKPVYLQQRLYQMNGGEDGHTPTLCSNMIPDFERDLEHNYFYPVRYFLEQCYVENFRAVGQLLIKDYDDDHIMYEHDLARMCNQVAFVEDCDAGILYLITYCWEKEPMQNEIRVLKKDDSGKKFEVILTRDISSLFGKLHQSYFAVNGKLFLQSADRNFTVLNGNLEEIGSGVMQDNLQHYDPNRPWHLKEYGEYMICSTNQTGYGLSQFHIYRKEDFLRIYDNSDDQKIQGNFCFDHDGKGYLIDKESSSVWTMDYSSGKTTLFAKELPIPCQELNRYEDPATRQIRFWGVAKAKVMSSRMLLYCVYEPDNNVPLETGGTIIPAEAEVEDAIWTPSGFYYLLREEELEKNVPIHYGAYVIKPGEKKGTRIRGFYLKGRNDRSGIFSTVAGEPVLILLDAFASEEEWGMAILDLMRQKLLGSILETDTSETHFMRYSLKNRGEDIFLQISEVAEESGRSSGKQSFLRHIDLKKIKSITLEIEADELICIHGNLAYLGEKDMGGTQDSILVYDMENTRFVQEFEVPFGLNRAANTLITKNDKRYLFRKRQSGDTVVTIFDEDGNELVTQPLDASCMPLQAGPQDVIPYLDGSFSPGIMRIIDE